MKYFDDYEEAMIEEDIREIRKAFFGWCVDGYSWYSFLDMVKNVYTADGLFKYEYPPCDEYPPEHISEHEPICQITNMIKTNCICGFYVTVMYRDLMVNINTYDHYYLITLSGKVNQYSIPEEFMEHLIQALISFPK